VEKLMQDSQGVIIMMILNDIDQTKNCDTKETGMPGLCRIFGFMRFL